MQKFHTLALHLTLTWESLIKPACTSEKYSVHFSKWPKDCLSHAI